MKCPKCLNQEIKVVDSREVEEEKAIRRRRECEKCSFRFTTYERIEPLNLLVVKKDGNREVYDRQKIISGIQKACEKRPISSEDIEKAVARIEEGLESLKKSEVSSTRIGELVIKELKRLDKVAYIRFASVYKSFEDIESFEEALKELKKKNKKK